MDLEKIVEWVGLSNRAIQNEYYFDRSKLVFVYSTESKYRYNDSSQTFDYSKLDNSFKGRYYFDEEKLIGTILTDNEHDKTKQKDASSEDRRLGYVWNYGRNRKPSSRATERNLS